MDNIRMKVDFPDPFGPRIPNISLRGTSRDTPSTAGTDFVFPLIHPTTPGDRSPSLDRTRNDFRRSVTDTAGLFKSMFKHLLPLNRLHRNGAQTDIRGAGVPSFHASLDINALIGTSSSRGM